jgi:hypothetical protein
MNFLNRLTSFFSAPKASTGRYYYFYVQCSRCTEKIRGRVDLFSDLSVDYGVGEEGEEREASQGETYFCRKVLIGEQRCYQAIEVELTFKKNNKNYQVIDQNIKGGKFIQEEEYLQGRE